MSVATSLISCQLTRKPLEAAEVELMLLCSRHHVMILHSAICS